MCEYVSGYVDLEGDQFHIAPDMMSHSACASFYGLVPDKWREFEWTSDDDGASLKVRVHEDDPHDSKWLKACILAKWPTRKHLIKDVEENVFGARVQDKRAECDNWGTLVGGNESWLTGGHISTLRARNDSVLVGGMFSVLAADNRSTVSGGERSTIQAGSDSVLDGGDYSVLIAGGRSILSGKLRSTLIGDHGSIFVGEDQSVFVGRYLDRNRGYFDTAIAVVGKNGIKPNTKYSINQDGEWVEVE